MIEMTDINELIKPPEGLKLESVEPAGAFLVLTYRSNVEYVKIYVNNGGREVLRVSGLG